MMTSHESQEFSPKILKFHLSYLFAFELTIEKVKIFSRCDIFKDYHLEMPHEFGIQGD